ncbi:FAD-dependent oxidoreductase [Hyphomonas sp.]|uniref:phytoene desaturase family protein n=1 Tax=Hyphomonas sp. TaxID=87 RepID=UPI0025B7BB4E|nr:FAD-dependent oxidoreductase [Hyphomonas sp.]
MIFASAMRRQVIIIGAGAGGLAAAIRLSAAGFSVTLLERHGHAGGKMRRVQAGPAQISNGPTVLTWRHIAEDLLRQGGALPTDEPLFLPCERLARHAWLDGTQLDLFPDPDESRRAICDAFGQKEAEGFRRYCEAIHFMTDTLRDSFMLAPKPDPVSLARRMGLHNPAALLATRPFSRLASELRSFFNDPRLIQLFGRYATYVGSSPFLAPATLMVISRVEQEGVAIVRGGMPALAGALLAAAERLGTVFRPDTSVRCILTDGGRTTGVQLADGERLSADIVLFNGDAAALSASLLGSAVRKAAPPLPRNRRSLSAITLCAHAQTRGFPLDYHTVLFGNDYADEFNAVFQRRRITAEPTVYICAEDRAGGVPSEKERLFCLINAPADGDLKAPWFDADEYPGWLAGYLGRFGLEVEFSRGATVLTRPEEFAHDFPGAGGALYGAVNHGPFDSFRRPASRSPVRGLYLAGGSAHPGAGVPMALVSGMLAADAICQDTDRAAPG